MQRDRQRKISRGQGRREEDEDKKGIMRNLVLCQIILSRLRKKQGNLNLIIQRDLED